MSVGEEKVGELFAKGTSSHCHGAAFQRRPVVARCKPYPLTALAATSDSFVMRVTGQCETSAPTELR